MYVCVYVNTCIHMYVCMYARMYVCMYVRMYVCMYVCIQEEKANAEARRLAEEREEARLRKLREIEVCVYVSISI